MSGPGLRLFGESLCSKHGFNDGDLSDDHWDELQAAGLDLRHVDWHAALRHLVRTHLVPAIEAAGHTIEVYDVGLTSHNPVRARVIDGLAIDDLGEGPTADEQSDLEDRLPSVTVPWAEVARVIKEVSQ